MFLCQSLILLLLAGMSESFTIASPKSSSKLGKNNVPSRSKLYNVPPKTVNDSDPATIKDAANREPPPQSFYQLGVNSVRAAELAIADGNKLIEIEVRNILSSEFFLVSRIFDILFSLLLYAMVHSFLLYQQQY
jgi:hypothetical protein